MELKGVIKQIGEIQTFPSGFQKREMVILTQEQYPQPILIEFLSEKTTLLDNVSEGDLVKVGINIRGREWTNPEGQVKYFNSITGWSVFKEQSQQQDVKKQSSADKQTKEPQQETNSEDPFSDEKDDLPF
jgi:hypothetical protein